MFFLEKYFISIGDFVLCGVLFEDFFFFLCFIVNLFFVVFLGVFIGVFIEWDLVNILEFFCEVLFVFLKFVCKIWLLLVEFFNLFRDFKFLVLRIFKVILVFLEFLLLILEDFFI